MNIQDPNHGKEYLTDEWRRHFENVGPNGVEFDLFNRNYSSDEKRSAALYWLRERRRNMEATEARRFRCVAWVASLTLLATIVGILVTYYR